MNFRKKEHSNVKPNPIETDDGKKYAKKVLNNILELKNDKRYSCCPSRGTLFAERFNRTKRVLKKMTVFEKGKASVTTALQSVIK